MVERLPAECYKFGQPRAVHLALIQDFLVNVRLMIEFLGIRPGRNGDAAAEFDPAWQPPSDPATVQTLLGHWELATKHVVHFSDESYVWKTLNQRRLERLPTTC
jgi:hypothetical protein